MFASKPILSSSNQTNLRLPSVSKSPRRRFRSSPSPSSISPTSVGTNTPENVSALKAKYDDYAMWLRAASRRNREPMFTHELLKHSLCQMGIDSTQAEQLVSTCTWYVYQFHKELEVDSEQRQQSNSDEEKKNSSTKKKRSKKVRSGKTKRTNSRRELSAESSATQTNSMSKENFVSTDSTPPSRSKYSVLPSIHSNDSAISPRSRRVDFDHEPIVSPVSTTRKTSHWRSAATKVRHLPKLRSSDVDSSTTITLDTASETNLLENDLSTSQRSLPRPTVTRSILRKQNSISSSVGSIDTNNRNHRHRLSTPASTIVDEVPLGTKSQRLFGGSECFAQIMNELEEQAL